MKNIAIIQPIITDYRSEFFNNISQNTKLDLYIYNNINLERVKGFSIDNDMSTRKLKSFTIGPFFIYNIIPFLNKKYEYLVIIGNVKHLSAWLLLVIGRFIGLKVIVWGHGISIPRYISESKRIPFIRLLMYRLAYGAWFYTEIEMNLYLNKIKKLTAVSLNNSISEVDEIIKIEPLNVEKKNIIKAKYKITTKYNLIICTRFEHPHRKADELLQIIQGINDDWGLIVIGDGELKPDFSSLENIYDFGSIYEREVKNELFLISDLYIQLGAIGLSVVEAFAYRLPIITLKRSHFTHHGVEYSYITDELNGFLCEDLKDVIFKINTFNKDICETMGINAQKFVKDNLSIRKMANSALSIIK
jgi:glycosyltransferase involved in cell wall biosynthesis